MTGAGATVNVDGVSASADLGSADQPVHVNSPVHFNTLAFHVAADTGTSAAPVQIGAPATADLAVNPDTPEQTTATVEASPAIAANVNPSDVLQSLDTGGLTDTGATVNVAGVTASTDLGSADQPMHVNSPEHFNTLAFHVATDTGDTGTSGAPVHIDAPATADLAVNPDTPEQTTATVEASPAIAANVNPSDVLQSLDTGGLTDAGATLNVTGVTASADLGSADQSMHVNSPVHFNTLAFHVAADTGTSGALVQIAAPATADVAVNPDTGDASVLAGAPITVGIAAAEQPASDQNDCSCGGGLLGGLA